MKDSAVLFIVAAVVVSTLLIAGAAIAGGAMIFTGCCGQAFSAGELDVKGIVDSLKGVAGQPSQIQSTPYQRVGPCKLELQSCSFDADCCTGLKCMGSCVNPLISEESKTKAQQYQAEVYSRVNKAAASVALQRNGTSANQTVPVENNTQNQTTSQDSQATQTQQPPAQTPAPAPPVQQPVAPKIVRVTLFKDNAGRQQLQSCVKDKLEGCTQPSPDGMFAVNYPAVATVSSGTTLEFEVEAEEATEYSFGFNYIAQVNGKNLVFQEAYSGWKPSKTRMLRINSGIGDGEYSIGTDTGGLSVTNKKLVAFVRVRNADGKNELGTSTISTMELGDDVTAIVYNVQ